MQSLIYLSPLLYLELALATILAVVFLWVRIEYGLFLYAFALGFPDAAIPLGSTINVRVDDILILLFLARTILWTPAPITRAQKNVLIWQGIFLGACSFSIAVESVLGIPPGAYEATKMSGCAAIFLALPRVIQTRCRLRYFLAGMMCGGIALVIQIHQHLGELGASNNFANFQQLKSAATFDTWNPNTLGQAAVLLVFAAGLGGVTFSKARAGRILWPSLAMAFALVPPLVFVRGTSLSIASGFLLFLLLARQWKWVLLFAAASLCAMLYLHARNPQLMTDATSVNVSTGEGFSHRFDRWGMALHAIEEQPFIGHGFGQELPYLTLIGSEGRAHDAYLAVWLELGLGGLLIFLGAILQFARAGCVLFRKPRFRAHGALMIALIVTLSLDSLGLPTLYWEKLPTIALALAVAVIGTCERDETAALENEVYDPHDYAIRPSLQLS